MTYKNSIPDNYKNSILVPDEFPDFIKENPDYDNFRYFLQAYYQWMENVVGDIQITNPGSGYTLPPNVIVIGDGTGAAARANIDLYTGQVSEIQLLSGGSGYTNAIIQITTANGDITGANCTAVAYTNKQLNFATRQKNLLSYDDIDRTSQEFIDYFYNVFLQYFPKNTLINKQTAIKASKSLYQSKGTQASYTFLFRVLYNSDFDLFNTSEAVLKPSDGLWYISRSLRLLTDDARFLGQEGYRIFGEESKALSVIQNVILEQGGLATPGANTDLGNKIRVFVSSPERSYFTGEFVRIVDTYNRDIIVDGQNLRARIIGQVDKIDPDPIYRGQYYQVGDPVIVYGGVTDEATDSSALAAVENVSRGELVSVQVVNGGYGFLPYDQIQYGTSHVANSIINVIPDNPNYNVVITRVNTAIRTNTYFIASDDIQPKVNRLIGASNYFFNNTAVSSADTPLYIALKMYNYPSYGISNVTIFGSAAGLNVAPALDAESLYVTDTDRGASLKTLGICGPIQIANSGLGYRVRDTIEVTGGSGWGANAEIKAVGANGDILRVEWTFPPGLDTIYPPGGMGYRSDSLPTLNVVSSNSEAYGASLYVPCILSCGENLQGITDKIGSIQKIKVIDGGFDYKSKPNVSLRVEDIVVSNVFIDRLPVKGDRIYQTVNSNASIITTYYANVNSISLLQRNRDPSKSLYKLRVFNYNTYPDTDVKLKIVRDANINIVMANIKFDNTYDDRGVRIYGDGTALANAEFINGLITSPGIYLNEKGQPSSFSVLQSEIYNNYTYQITVEKEIKKYRSLLLNLLHPAGTKLVGRYAIKSNTNQMISATSATFKGFPIWTYTGYKATAARMVADFENTSNNIITLYNTAAANIAGFIFPNTTSLVIDYNRPPQFRSLVKSVDEANNQVTLYSNVWLTYGNVAYVEGQQNTNILRVRYVTNTYNLINNGDYSDPLYPLKDIIFSGDNIKVDNNDIKIVSNINYNSGLIYTTSNLTSNTLSYISVNRTVDTGTFLDPNQIFIYGPIGTIFRPELTTEDDRVLTTEDDQLIILG